MTAFVNKKMTTRLQKAEEKGKIITVRVGDELHRPARIKTAEMGTSLQAVLVKLLKSWTFAEEPEQRKILESRGTNNEMLDGLSKDAKKLIEDTVALIRRDRMAFKLLRHMVDRLYGP
jgi:hypothetical protein